METKTEYTWDSNLNTGENPTKTEYTWESDLNTSPTKTEYNWDIDLKTDPYVHVRLPKFDHTNSLEAEIPEEEESKFNPESNDEENKQTSVVFETLENGEQLQTVGAASSTHLAEDEIYYIEQKPSVPHCTEYVYFIKPEPIDTSPKRAKTTKRVKKESKRKLPGEENKKTTKRRKLSGYNKKRVLEHLQQHGSTSAALEEVTKSFGVSKTVVTEFFNAQIKNAEDHAHQECPRKVFHKVEQLLQTMKQQGVALGTQYEPAVIINEIVHKEAQPDPKSLGGIDLKAAYKFLGNALLGLPQPKLNVETEEFLANQTMDLFREMASIESPSDLTETIEGQVVTELEANAAKSWDILMQSLDPFGLHSSGSGPDVQGNEISS